MPTIIGQEAPLDFAGVPRRMSTEDVDLWYRFKAANLISPQRLLFDVGIGTGKSGGPGVDREWDDFWMRETQRRIDLLVIERNRQIIVELRKRALANALGRLIVYRKLYSLDPLAQTPIETWLVTDTTDPELAALFTEHGVRWITI